MSVLSVLEAVAIPAAILTVIWLCYRLDVRRQEREAREAGRWAERQAARYWELEFDLAPPVFDQEQDAA